MDIAKIIIEHMPAIPEVQSVTAAPPGFINFKLSSSWLTELVSRILEQGEDYGNGILGKGTRVQIEFVSANPTGPLHLGNGRGAVLGSALASVLAAAGYTVEKEYYFNDAGNQMDTLGRSLYYRYRELLGEAVEFPEGHYQGDYMRDLAREFLQTQLRPRPKEEVEHDPISHL